jgi:DNA-binding MarR family transcriptional regulator
VLWALYDAPDRRLRMGELSGEVYISRTGLTRLVDRLERAGLLRRETVPGDRRGFYAVLTADGARMLRKMWPVYERAVATCFAPHVGRGRTPMRKALEAIADAAG